MNAPVRFEMKKDVIGPRLDSLISNAPRRFKEASQRWGRQILVPFILKSAKDKDIKPFRRNGLFAKTRWVDTSIGGKVIMPISGIYQDRATPHWVPVTKNSNPMLKAWSMRYRKALIGFYFKPRPFIHTGVENALRVAPQYWRRGLRFIGKY